MKAKTDQRDRVIIRTSIIGILTNIVLALFKAVVGLLSHSIAIVLDAINNLSDALSSVITIIGTKLAGRLPDKKHPLGYGRIEYLSAAIISLIVLYAGVTSFVESIKKIMHPDTPEYSTVTLMIVAVAIVTKILLGRFVKSTGEKVNSASLVASGSDAMFDAIISASTLVAAIIFLVTKVSLEAYLGVIISAVIIKSGIEMLSSTLSEILGERVETDLSREIKNYISQMPEVYGAYDLLLHNYGPDTLIGSVHVEVDDTLTAWQIDELSRKIQTDIHMKYHVIITSVGIYAINTTDDVIKAMRTDIARIVHGHEDVLQMHGFYVDETRKVGSFDVIVDFASENRMKTYQTITEEVKAAYPDYRFIINLDSDLSD